MHTSGEQNCIIFISGLFKNLWTLIEFNELVSNKLITKFSFFSKVIFLYKFPNYYKYQKLLLPYASC